MVLSEQSATSQSAARLAVLFADLGRKLMSEHGLDSTLGLVSTRSVELVPNAEHAAVSRGRRGQFETVGSTSDLPLRVDQIQYDLRSGPCVDAATQHETFRTGNLAARGMPSTARRLSKTTGRS